MNGPSTWETEIDCTVNSVPAFLLSSCLLPRMESPDDYPEGTPLSLAHSPICEWPHTRDQIPRWGRLEIWRTYADFDNRAGIESGRFSKGDGRDVVDTDTHGPSCRPSSSHSSASSEQQEKEGRLETEEAAPAASSPSPVASAGAVLRPSRLIREKSP